MVDGEGFIHKSYWIRIMFNGWRSNSKSASDNIGEELLLMDI